MKKKLVVVLMAAVMAMTAVTGCGSKADDAKNDTQASKTSESETSANADQEAAMHVADLIDAIYVQERTDDTDKQCKEAKEAWDKLTDAQKELVEGENADPDYFGRDTGDASKDDPRNQDDIGENEILVVSFGTSFNNSRVADIKGVEDAIAAANPDWSVRRAFTAQIIINHVQARDDEKIDNMDQALERAVKNGVKNLVVQPTHLMHGAEYDELSEAVEKYKDKFESVKIAEPLLGEVGSDATVVNEDKKAVAEILTKEAVEKAGYDSLDAAKEEGTAFVFMGHGTSHTAKISYSQMQSQMTALGYENVFIGTVEVSRRIHHVSLSLRRCQPLATRMSFFVRLWLLQETMPTMIWQEVMMIHGFHSLRHQESLIKSIHRLTDLVRLRVSRSFMLSIHLLP